MNGWIPFGDFQLSADYKLAPHMVVFSHGFGVKRDSRGMFTDIAAALPADIGYVLFDYNDIDEAHNLVHASGFREQANRLKAVVEWVGAQAGVKQVSLIGHSLGCLVIAELAAPTIQKIILLAPPTNLQGSTWRDLYTKRPDAQLVRGVWHIPRRDGSTTLISEAVLDELGHVDAEGELVKLAMLQPYLLVIPEADDVLLDDDYTELMVMDAITSVGIEGADHNFSDTYRAQLIETIRTQLG